MNKCYNVKKSSCMVYKVSCILFYILCFLLASGVIRDNSCLLPYHTLKMTLSVYVQVKITPLKVVRTRCRI